VDSCAYRAIALEPTDAIRLLVEYNIKGFSVAIATALRAIFS
jgi:hypothetical protein